MEIQAELDAVMEGQLGLASAVDVGILFGLHPTIVVVQHSLDHSVTDGLKRKSRKLKHIRSFGKSLIGRVTRDRADVMVLYAPKL